MPRICYCHIITDKVNQLKRVNLSGNMIFGLKEMEKWQKDSYEELGHVVESVKCTIEKPKL